MYSLTLRMHSYLHSYQSFVCERIFFPIFGINRETFTMSKRKFVCKTWIIWKTATSFCLAYDKRRWWNFINYAARYQQLKTIKKLLNSLSISLSLLTKLLRFLSTVATLLELKSGFRWMVLALLFETMLESSIIVSSSDIAGRHFDKWIVLESAWEKKKLIYVSVSGKRFSVF